MTRASCIYEGVVRHRRFVPVEHAFNFSLFLLYLDLEELPELFTGSRLYSCDAGGVARFRRRDHLRGLGLDGLPLREAVGEVAVQRGAPRPAGPVRLLTHLEYFGYRFNPVSFYFCFDRAGREVETLIAEINNTPWGEQHCYVLTRGEAARPGRMHFRFGKQFHISPFMPMDHEYEWRFSAPGERLGVFMRNRRGAETVFDAHLALRRREMTPAALRGVLFRYPLMTARVIAAIHFEALRLWMKRVPYHPHPKAVVQRMEPS